MSRRSPFQTMFALDEGHAQPVCGQRRAPNLRRPTQFGHRPPDGAQRRGAGPGGAGRGRDGRQPRQHHRAGRSQQVDEEPAPSTAHNAHRVGAPYQQKRPLPAVHSQTAHERFEVGGMLTNVIYMGLI